MTTTYETTPLATDELLRLKESLTPENRCELAYSGETVARLIETLSLQFLRTSQLQDRLDRCHKIAIQADRQWAKSQFGLISSSIDDIRKISAPARSGARTA